MAEPALRRQLLDCPSCGSRGSRVSRTTLEHQVTGELGSEPYRFCRTVGCAVVYFGTTSGHTVATDALVGRVGQKEAAADRPVCTCFGFSAADIAGEVADTCRSTIPEQIRERCAALEARCEETNPSGKCCLAEAQSIAKEALDKVWATGCCGPSTEPSSGGCC